MKNPLTTSEFKQLLHKIESIDELLINDLTIDATPSWSDELWYQMESASVRVSLSKYYYGNKLLLASVDNPIYRSSYELITKNRTIKYLSILKKRNVKLNYNFIKYMIEETTSLQVISWCVANSNYLDQWMRTEQKKIYFNDRDYANNQRFVEPIIRDYWFTPIKTHHFIYNCLRFNELDKVKIFAKAKFDINEDNLLERIYIELNTESDWDILFLLNLFVLNDNFDWDVIDPIIRVELIYSVYGHNKIYPNIFTNKKIKKFLANKINSVGLNEIINYENFKNTYHEYYVLTSINGLTTYNVNKLSHDEFEYFTNKQNKINHMLKIIYNGNKILNN